MLSEAELQQVKEHLRKKQTGWIKNYNKEELIEICESLEVDVKDFKTLEEIRTSLLLHLKKIYSSEENSTRVIRKMTSFGNLQQFKKGSNWITLESQMDAFITLNDIDDTKKTALLLTQISTEVFEELQAISDEEIKSLNITQLKKKLSELYTPKKNTQLHRQQFKTRKQKPEETIREYYVALQTLAKKCNFEKAEIKGQLRDQLIAGTSSRNIKYEFLKSAEQDLQKLITLAEIIEVTDTETDLLSSTKAPESETPVYAIKTKGIYNSNSRTQDNMNRRSNFVHSKNQIKRGTTANSTICYCCGGKNHLKAECYLRNKYCNECGK